jgi:Glycosyltransferase
MSERLPTIWMNVTTSANWQRPPVGIVRVECSLRDELAKLYGSRFKQCVWQGEKFVEWVPQLAAVDGEKPAKRRAESTNHLALPMMFPILPKKQAFLALGQGLLSLTPSWVRPSFNRFLYRVRPIIARVLASARTRRLIARLRARASAYTGVVPVSMPKGSGSPVPGTLFSPGDVLISVGMDWDYPYYKQFYDLRKRVGVKVVTCCYDLIPVLYPQYCVNDVAKLFTSYFLDVADGSDLILCISKQSEKDLSAMLYDTGGARPLTRVFPMGDNVPLSTTEVLSPEVRSICREPFILFVSTIERRKNHEVLYRAYHLLCSQGKRAKLPKLVFVGMQGWGVAELMRDIELDPLTNGLIVRLNYVSDAELRALYEAAQFCVFPSLYEGWGLPVGEALSLGKAVICSNRGSLPEVGGELVTYINPWDPQAWADEIYRMVTDPEFLRNLETKVRNEYQSRTWSDAAASVKDAIDSLLIQGQYE